MLTSTLLRYCVSVCPCATIPPLGFGGSAIVPMQPSDFGESSRATQEALRESEERFRLLIEGVKEYAIFMLDPTGRVATWNDGAERIKGYRAKEIIGKHFSQFYLPEDRAAGKPDRELEIASRTGKYEEEGRRVRNDGTAFWASVLITAIRNKAGELV